MKESNVVQLFPLPEILTGKISQATWNVMHPELRKECERAATELTAGMAKYAPAALRWEALAEFHQLAESQGTNLAEVMSRFVNMENLLRADPVKGIELLLEKTGIDMEAWAIVTMAGVHLAHGMFLEKAAQAIRDEPGKNWEGLHFGFMADEVERVRPDCVIKQPNGYLAVDYDRLSKTPEARSLPVYSYFYKDFVDSLPEAVAS